MLHVTSAVLCFLVVVDPKKEDDKELKAQLATITKQLNSKKNADIIAGLEAAQKLGTDAEPLIRRICEHVFTKNDDLAGVAADALKEVCPKIHLTVLAVRSAVIATNANHRVIFETIGKLDEGDGAPLAWLVHKHMAELVSTGKGLGADRMNAVEIGFATLRKMGDTSESHWQLARKYRRDFPDRINPSYENFIESDRSKMVEHVKVFVIGNRTSWTANELVLIGAIGKDAKDVLPKLRAIAKLSSDIKVRESAADAVASIEAALKEEPKKKE